MRIIFYNYRVLQISVIILVALETYIYESHENNRGFHTVTIGHYSF